ncbi:Hypothetical predicted protein [Paramuricea clavata]|nr:Hypothetical predicted protein [Paramuricea clavata]
MAKPDEFNEYEESQQDETETPEKEKTANDEESKMVMEDMNTETSMALVENDPDTIKNKGLCHYGIAVWFKPGASVRCNCMKCTCKNGGNWACAYNFAYCPYFYCGNQIYNPSTQICCCGKVHAKKRHHACCGYFYYDARYSQCCNYFSVKSKKAKCPRFRI